MQWQLFLYWLGAWAATCMTCLFVGLWVGYQEGKNDAS